jgi:hypothetical protein
MTQAQSIVKVDHTCGHTLLIEPGSPLDPQGLLLPYAAQGRTFHSTAPCPDCVAKAEAAKHPQLQTSVKAPGEGTSSTRCAVCGKKLAAPRAEGCHPGACATRPVPAKAWDPERAEAEEREYDATHAPKVFDPDARKPYPED